MLSLTSTCMLTKEVRLPFTSQIIDVPDLQFHGHTFKLSLFFIAWMLFCAYVCMLSFTPGRQTFVKSSIFLAFIFKVKLLEFRYCCYNTKIIGGI